MVVARRAATAATDAHAGGRLAVVSKRCYDAVDRLPCRPFDLGAIAEIAQLPDLFRLSDGV